MTSLHNDGIECNGEGMTTSLHKDISNVCNLFAVKHKQIKYYKMHIHVNIPTRQPGMNKSAYVNPLPHG